MLGLGLGTAAVVILLDQLTKAAVLAHFAGRVFDIDRLTPFFSLVLTYNRGMSFGLFNTSPAGGDAGHALLFSIAAAIVVAGLVFWLKRVANPLLATAIGLIVGGALGNVVDRVRYGAVVDFLDFHVGYWHWPAFNVADSAICLGVALLLFDGLLLRREVH
jgi:signal peptidase II